MNAAIEPSVPQLVLEKLTEATQNYDVLLHLMQKPTITQVEAHELYRVYRLASRINDLKNLGVLIVSTRVVDLTGRNYTRYSLA